MLNILEQAETELIHLLPLIASPSTKARKVDDT